jgi:threonine/homoserine/homoserine lactone efflux protein
MTFGVFVAYGLVAHGFRRHVVGSLRLQQALRGGFSVAFAALGARLALTEH